MTESSTVSAKRPVWAMYVLLLLFASPFLVSWWMYYFTELGRDGGAYSHGQLILPPIPMEDMTLFDPGAGMREHHLHGKWNLLYISNGGCDHRCDQRLSLMRQLWLAAGNDNYRLQRVLMITNITDKPVIYQQLNKYNGQLVVMIKDSNSKNIENLFKQGTEDRPLDSGRLYLIDPLGNLMMSYPLGIDPTGIIKDLKRLLKYSRIG
jgi:cytochrome oxidase Cu insertion factor (SCO1/SenC/PrrC family)